MSRAPLSVRERRAAYAAMIEAASAARAGKIAGRRTIKLPSGRTIRTEDTHRYLVVDDSKLLSRPRKIKATDSLATAILTAERTGSRQVWIVDTRVTIIDGIVVCPIKVRNGAKGSPWVTP